MSLLTIYISSLEKCLFKLFAYIWIGLFGFLVGGSVVKNLPANTREVGSILGREDPLEKEVNGSPLQYPCLGNPMDRGAWWATVHRVIRSWTWLCEWTTIHSRTWLITRHIICKHSPFCMLPLYSGDSVFWWTIKKIQEVQFIYSFSS